MADEATRPFDRRRPVPTEEYGDRRDVRQFRSSKKLGNIPSVPVLSSQYCLLSIVLIDHSHPSITVDASE
jgi:hypothetical protein